MTGFYPEKYKYEPKPAPGNAEIIAGNYLVMIFRALRVSMPLEGDVRAVERTGELMRRWWKNTFRT